MLRQFPVLAVFLFLFTGSLFTQECNDYDEKAEERSLKDMIASVPEAANSRKIGALLLKNKLLLEGETEFDNGQYLVKTKFGISRQSKANVEYTAEDTAEIYRYVQGKTDLGDFKKVVEFAQWCKKSNLREEALAEFARAKTLAPDAASLKMVDDMIRLNRLDRPAQLAGVAAPDEKAVEPEPEQETEFDYFKWGRAIPPSVYNSFTKTAQPILLSRCAAVDCHNSLSEQEYKLHAVGGADGKLKTLQNLKATLERLDINDPDESTILVVAVRAHGGNDPMLNKRTEKQFQALYAWTQQTAQLLPQPLPSPLQKEELLISNREGAAKNGVIRQVNAWTPLNGGGEPTTKNGNPTNRVAPKPIDPYDPSAFNERYHARETGPE